MASSDTPYAGDVLDEIEAELAASPAVPVAGQVAVSPERMAALTARLRDAVEAARAIPRDAAARRAALQPAQAEAALIRAEARRKADMLLDGTRVRRLREEYIQSIIGESRQHGEHLVAEAYAYARERLEEVIRRAEEARRLVSQAGELVRVEPPGAARRLAQLVAERGAGGFLGGAFSRFFRP
jgi:hypothetical protein